MKSYLVMVREKSGNIAIKDVCDDGEDAMKYQDYQFAGNEMELIILETLGRTKFTAKPKGAES